MKKIIIIGGTSGIGKELALLYAGQKNRIGVTGRMYVWFLMANDDSSER